MDLNLMADINAYLLARLPIAGSIPEDFFPGDADAEFMCRHDPSPVLTKRYLDGSFWGTFNFSYYASSKDVVAARQSLESIAAVLNLETFSGLFGVTEGRLIVVTRPVPVSKDESGVTIQTSSYRLVFFKEVH